MPKTIENRRAKPSVKVNSSARSGTSLKTAFQQIRDLIVHGQLAPGSWIVETDLTSRLGMSRTPIRGALHLLQREGYVVEQKGITKSRMLVAPLTNEDAQELYAIVGHLEGLAAAQITALPRPRRLELQRRIQDLNQKLRQIARTHKLEGENIFDLDTEFHRIIVEATAGPRLLEIHNSIKPQTERYWRLYASNIMEDLDIVVEEHQEIISAIGKDDRERIERALQANWVNGAGRLSRLIEFSGERGTW
jgi:DNA-binding GntR family transcriptional regulator